MAAVLDVRPTDEDLEDLWRFFHTGWVRAHESLLELQARLDEGATASDLLLLNMLEQQERQQREVLEQFERRLHEFRSRASAYRRSYL